jgi:hypothetical protein
MVTKRKVDKEIPRPPSIKLRDYFAALAMQAIIGRGSLDTDMNVTPYCLDAYTIADAMLEASSSPATAKAPATTSKRIIDSFQGCTLTPEDADAIVEELGKVTHGWDRRLKMNAAEVRLILALRAIESRPGDGKCNEMEAVNAAVESYIEESCARKIVMRHN